MQYDSRIMRPSDRFRVRMREARERLGLSQRGLVLELEALGVAVSQPAVCLIESGERGVSLDEAVGIAQALRVPLDHLYLPDWDDYLVMEAEAGR
jgi:transcriptional regulator with XRE-family HTH domain